MIEFEDKKYGKVIIVNDEDRYKEGIYFSGYKDGFKINMYNRITAYLIGYRDIIRGEVKILKNRHSGLAEDYEIEQFILNYGEEKETYEPIYSRFEILDI